MWNRPEDAPDEEIHRMADDDADPPPVRSRLAPEKPEGVPIYFDEEVPMQKVWQWLAGFGLKIDRSLRTGQLVARLTPEARAKLEAEAVAMRLRDTPRQRSVDEGFER